jgi:hypothetical protein
MRPYLRRTMKHLANLVCIAALIGTMLALYMAVFDQL